MHSIGISLRGQAANLARKDSEDIFFLKNKIEKETLQTTLNNLRNGPNRYKPNSSSDNMAIPTRDSSASSGTGVSTSSSSSSSLGSSSMGDLKNVFTELGNISETKAQNDQRRFREDLPFQSRIYQDFDTEAAKRTEGIDTRAREQNSNLTKDRMRLQSQQNMAEEQNRGKVQVSTTGQTRDADLKRALSVLPRK